MCDKQDNQHLGSGARSCYHYKLALCSSLLYLRVAIAALLPNCVKYHRGQDNPMMYSAPQKLFTNIHEQRQRMVVAAACTALFLVAIDVAWLELSLPWLFLPPLFKVSCPRRASIYMGMMTADDDEYGCFVSNFFSFHAHLLRFSLHDTMTKFLNKYVSSF